MLGWKQCLICSLIFEKREDLTFESQTLSELESAVTPISFGPWKTVNEKTKSFVFCLGVMHEPAHYENAV